MVTLAFRGWLYGLCLEVGTYFVLLVGVWILAATGLVVALLVHKLNGQWRFHLARLILEAVVAHVWIGWRQFTTGRWIARRAPGRELAAGVTACLTPMALSLPLGFLAMHFWGAEINRYIAIRPANPDSLPALLPTEIFLLAGILWSRHKFLRSVAG
jgi:hypothetical protein